MNLFDTIVAPITGTEPAAVAVVRVSGPQSYAVAEKVFSPWHEPVEARKALYGTFAHGDDGIALPFAEGHSYTGEATVEFSVHGSRASVRSLVDACLAAGARLAAPGEFTRRAFMNGRLDLTQAEGVRETIESETEAQLRLANALRGGDLKREVAALREKTLHVAAVIEASVDFPDEIGEFDRDAAIATLLEVRANTERLLATARLDAIVRTGYRIAILGQPNAGKSSLLNALMGTDRAIVTDIPGTTRDTLEERLDLGGVPCVVTDTAGLRDSHDPIERIGIGRSHRAEASADLVWYVVDAAKGLDDEDRAHLTRLCERAWLILTKCDLANGDGPGLRVSAKTGQGLDALRQAVAERAGLGSTEGRWLAINDRHADHLREADTRLAEAVETLDSGLPVDLASIHLQSAAMEFGTITGETATLDLIDRVFRDFCVGK